MLELWVWTWITLSSEISCPVLPLSAGGGVILYAGSSGSSSPSPGSPSSGYQTQSPSSHSQPSSPEEVTFTEIGALKQRAGGCSTPSSKLVFQFPEVYSGPSAAATPQHTYAHPIAGKRPCGFPGTFTSKHFLTVNMHKDLCLDLHFCSLSNHLFILPQRQVEWSCFAKSVGTLHLVSTMECMHVRVAR